MKSILHLSLHRDYFEKIANGTKRSEDRELKPYWRKRLDRRRFDLIQFRNGYPADAPEMLVECRGIRREPQNSRHAIRLGRVLAIQRGEP